MDQTEIKNIEILEIEKKHEDGIIELLCTVFKKSKNEKLISQFRYLNYENPNQDYKPLGIVAVHNNRIVGYRGFITLPFLVGDKSIKILMLISGAIYPEFRGLGLFIKMHEMAYSIYDNNYDYFLNTSANQKSGPSYIKQKWTILGDKEYLFRLNLPFPLFKKQLFNIEVSSSISPQEIIEINQNSIFKEEFKVNLDLKSLDNVNWIFGKEEYQFAVYKKNLKAIAYCCFTIKDKNCYLIHFDMVNKYWHFSFIKYSTNS